MPNVSFSGLASGLDSQSIIAALMKVERVPIARLEAKNDDLQSQKKIINNLTSALSNLSNKAEALSTTGDFLSYKGSISDSDIASVTASGASVSGKYSLEVTSLAHAQRTYSREFDDADTTQVTATEQTLGLTVGGALTNVTIAAGATLEDVVSAINSSGADVTAGLLYTGSKYHLQVVGNQTGNANAVTFSEGTLNLQLTNTVQAAVDADFEVDGFRILSASNTITDVLPGTTLELKSENPGAPASIEIKADPEGVKSKLADFVKAYNDVFSIVNAQVGMGKGGNTLNGDSTLRSVEQGLHALVSSAIPGLSDGSGNAIILADLGIETQRDGTLALDASTLDDKLSSNFRSVAQYFAGSDAGVSGMSALMTDLIEDYTDGVDGLLSVRSDGIDDLVASNEKRILELTSLNEKAETNLRNRFTQLEQTMLGLQSQQQYLAQILL